MKKFLKKIEENKIAKIKENPNPSAHREMGWYIGCVLTLITTTIMHNTMSLEVRTQAIINFGLCLLVFFLLETIQDKVLDGTNTWKDKAIDIKDYMVNAMLFCPLFPLIFEWW